MEWEAQFVRLRKMARGLRVIGPEKPQIQFLEEIGDLQLETGRLSCKALLAAYLNMVEEAADAGVQRPHRHVRDRHVVEIGGTKHNMGQLLCWGFGTEELTENSIPKVEVLRLV